ncbi:MAG: methylenetetrahydrofolate reductase C-terminal domain-containing protein [Lachnospiraceae bacterium]|nr:methylenetetrahydrofolate reductase C-terminal domain-containing protein [Lachnospiraceae bacterium]
MIITQKKPIDELMAMLGDAKKIAILGCGSCATACATGGEKEVQELKAYLESNGKTVVATGMADYCCMNMGTKTAMKKLAAGGPDAVVCMSCGDGVQVAAKHINVPVYPSNNTMFLGEAVRLGLFEEACHLCGNCVLGTTGGICPISRCAKSLVNGPCGGQKNGKCEVNPENECAWIMIYNKLESMGQLDKLAQTRPDKGYKDVSYPRTINARGNK